MTATSPAPWINAHNGFDGIWPALLTPLDERLDIDHDKLAAHAAALLAGGCGGVTLFGTTGEGPSFTLRERMQALERLIAAGVPAQRIIVSTSCAALAETLALTRHAVELGAHGCLMLPPFFFKGIGDAGVLACYREVLQALPRSDWRLYLYHIPQVAGVGLPADVISRLLESHADVIAGIKDSSGERAHSVALAQRFMPGLTVYVGHEPDLRTLGRLGSTGAISGLANFMPTQVRGLVKAPDAPAATQDEQTVLRLLAGIKGYALLPALKSIMAHRAGDARWLRVRAPLVAADQAEHRAIGRLLDELERPAAAPAL